MKNKTKQTTGWLDNFNDSKVSLPPGFVGEGTFNGPQWESPAWGGQFQKGGEMKFYQNGLDWKPKGMKNGGWLGKYDEAERGIIKDDMGYWNPKNWDSPVEIGSNYITMQDVPFDVLGISDEGDVQHMKANSPKNYKYKGNKVTEFRMAKNGIRQEQKGLQNLDNLTNFTNYNKPTNWLNKYN